MRIYKKEKKEEVALPTLSNRQDQYTFISPVTFLLAQGIHAVMST
jgi:hypothetical protein